MAARAFNHHWLLRLLSHARILRLLSRENHLCAMESHDFRCSRHSTRELHDSVSGLARSAKLAHGFGYAPSRMAIAGLVQHALHLRAEVGHIDALFAVRTVHRH